MGKKVFGLDIGAGSIKLVELEKTADGIHLHRAKFFDLTHHADQEKREAAIAEGIEGLLKAEKIKGGTAAISLSGQSVFIRFLKLPKIQKGKIKKIIRYEAQQQIPFPLDNITWDHQIFHSPESAEQDVLFVAAKKDIVETTLGYLSRTNLDVELVDVSPLSLLNAIRFNEPLGRGLILDIGAKATNLIVVQEKGFWVRSILIAGDEMTHAIASKLKMPFDKAEELKRKEGLVLTEEGFSQSLTSTERDLAEILSPIAADLLTSVVQSLEFYRTKYGRDVSFDELILSGGSSKLKGIEDFISKNMGMQVRRANIAQKMKCPSSLRVDIDFQTRFGAAIGLALHLIQKCPTRIDLLTAERKAERDFKKERLYIFSSAMLLALIPLTVAFYMSNLNENYKGQLKSLSEILTKYDLLRDEVSALDNKIKNVNTKLQPFDELAVERSLVPEMLLEVEKLLPYNTWITAFKKEQDNLVVLEGQTVSNFLTITEFKNKLSESGMFESVEILYAGEAQGVDIKVINFAIKFKLKGRS